MRTSIIFILLSLFLIISTDRNEKAKKFLNKNHHLLRKLEISEGILMGFNNFENRSNLIKFNAKIKYPSEEKIKQNVVIPINISFTNEKDPELRRPNCSMNIECNNLYCTYACSETIVNKNISKVKFNDKDENYKYSLSSLANITKDISSKKDSDNKNRKILDRNEITFLENTNIYSKSGRHFVLKGKMDPGYESDNIKLIVSKNTYSRELQCKGYKDKLFPKDYFLECDTSTSSINADLQNTFAYLEDDDQRGFIINFDKSGNSTTNSTIETNDYVPKKKSKGISTGGIVAIVIPCIILLLLAIGLVFSLRRRAPNPPLKELANTSNTLGPAGASSEAVVHQ